MAYPTNKELREKHIANRVANMKENWPELNKEHFTNGRKPEGWLVKKWENFIDEYIGQLHNELDIAFSAKGGITSLLDSPKSETMKGNFDLNCYKGKLAGNILIWIRRMADSNLTTGASVNKAVFMVEEITMKGFNNILKEKGWPFHQSFVRQDVWLIFKSVSPLWAAYEYWLQWGKPSNCSPFSSKGFVGFISLANNFKEFGINHFPRTQKTPTLISDETWPKSDDIKLIDLNVKQFPLSNKELKVLDNYQAPGSYLSSRP